MRNDDLRAKPELELGKPISKSGRFIEFLLVAKHDLVLQFVATASEPASGALCRDVANSRQTSEVIPLSGEGVFPFMWEVSR